MSSGSSMSNSMSGGSSMSNSMSISSSMSNSMSSGRNIGDGALSANCLAELGAPVRKKRRMTKKKVDHTYRDFSKHSIESAQFQLGRTGKETSFLKQRASEHFPHKLYEILTNPLYQHIISFVSIAIIDL